MPESLTPEIVRENIHAIERRIAEAEAVMIQARVELLDWRAAERLLANRAGDPGGASASDSAHITVAVENPAKTVTPFKEGTNKAFLFQAAWESPAIWNTANELQVLASRLKGSSIPMSSVSPTLTEMVQKDGVMVRDGMKVALASRSEGMRTALVREPGFLHDLGRKEPDYASMLG